MISIRPKYKSKRSLIHLKRSADGIRIGLRQALFEIGRENVKHTRKLIADKNKNGRIYIINGFRHQASAPGEAPANLTGTLQKSVGYTVRGSQQMEFGDTIYYGRYLEEGTKKMAARPHLARTVKEKARDAEQALQGAVDRELKRRATR